jgi:hypothetical protein
MIAFHTGVLLDLVILVSGMPARIRALVYSGNKKGTLYRAPGIYDYLWSFRNSSIAWCTSV